MINPIAGNQKCDLMYELSVTQHQIDIEDDIEIMVDNRPIKLKLPGIAEEGTRLRLPGEGQNGGDLYVKIHVTG